MLEELERHDGRSACESIGDEEQLCPDDVGGCRVALPNAMLEDQAPVELGGLRRVDARSFPHADAGCDAVDRHVAVERRLDDRARSAHSAGNVTHQLDGFQFARDAQDILEPKSVTGELYGHEGIVSRTCPPA